MENMKFYPYDQYQPLCESLFREYRDTIVSVLPTARVEHIGASAIEGCISKGDLDIFVGVNQAEFEQAVSVLCQLGFHEKKDTLRTDSLCMLLCDDQTHDVALQVVANGTEFECFLHFRDALQDNPIWIAEYNALKLSCTGWQADDYRREKNKFVEGVLKNPIERSKFQGGRNAVTAVYIEYMRITSTDQRRNLPV